jgi:hypothetical protein
VHAAAGAGQQRGDKALLGQHGVQHHLGAEGVFLAHAVIQHRLGVGGHGRVGAARPRRRCGHPLDLIGAEAIQQRGSAGRGGRCPENGENVTSFHIRCPVCQCLDQVVILLVAQRPQAPLTVTGQRCQDRRDLPGRSGGPGHRAARGPRRGGRGGSQLTASGQGVIQVGGGLR